MKKITLSMVTILLALSLVFSLAACGQTPETETEALVEVTEEVTEVVETEAPTEEQSPEEKIQSYIESDELKDVLDSMASAFESVGTFEVKAEGESLVYEITYNIEIPDSSLEEVKTQLDSSFESLASTYELVANMLKTDLGLENPTVVLRINNSDGTNIVSYEYKATE